MYSVPKAIVQSMSNSRAIGAVCMRTPILYCLTLTAIAVPAWGVTVNFSGVFSADDNVQLFTYTVQNGGQVTVSTTSYAAGGFSPILSLRSEEHTSELQS